MTDLASLVRQIVEHWDEVLTDEAVARREDKPSDYDSRDLADALLTDLFKLARAIGKQY